MGRAVSMMVVWHWLQPSRRISNWPSQNGQRETSFFGIAGRRLIRSASDEILRNAMRQSLKLIQRLIFLNLFCASTGLPPTQVARVADA